MVNASRQILYHNFIGGISDLCFLSLSFKFPAWEPSLISLKIMSQLSAFSHSRWLIIDAPPIILLARQESGTGTDKDYAVKDFGLLDTRSLSSSLLTSLINKFSFVFVWRLICIYRKVPLNLSDRRQADQDRYETKTMVTLKRQHSYHRSGELQPRLNF